MNASELQYFPTRLLSTLKKCNPGEIVLLNFEKSGPFFLAKTSLQQHLLQLYIQRFLYLIRFITRSKARKPRPHETPAIISFLLPENQTSRTKLSMQ